MIVAGRLEVAVASELSALLGIFTLNLKSQKYTKKEGKTRMTKTLSLQPSGDATAQNRLGFRLQILWSRYLRRFRAWIEGAGLRPGVRHILPGEQIAQAQYWIQVPTSRPPENQHALETLVDSDPEVISMPSRTP